MLIIYNKKIEDEKKNKVNVFLYYGTLCMYREGGQIIMLKQKNKKKLFWSFNYEVK